MAAATAQLGPGTAVGARVFTGVLASSPIVVRLCSGREGVAAPLLVQGLFASYYMARCLLCAHARVHSVNSGSS